MEGSTSLSSVPDTENLRLFFLNSCDPPVCLTDDETSDSGRRLWVQEIDVIKLLIQCPSMSQQLFDSPISTIEHLKGEVAALCFNTLQDITPSKISVRFTHFPPIQVSIPTLPPPHGALIQACGTVVRMSTKRVVPFMFKRMCLRCRQTVECFTSPFDRSSVTKMYCESTSCKKEELQVVDQVWMDYAECRLQQRSSGSGELPRSILVTLDDELSTKCSVGQFIEVIGIIFQKWKHVYPGSRPVIEPTIWASNVLPMEAYRGTAVGGSDADTPLEFSELSSSDTPHSISFTPENFFLSFKKQKLKRTVALVNSTCPQLSGLFAPRLAMLLATVGGGTSTTHALRLRSTIHCLLVGDPSTGKSQLLRFASQIAPRSTCTTGIGSTSAGLTVAATKEQGEWVLEPGALVLSDGGSCIIDELRTVAVSDRASLHEAMEQQTISVAKGGLVTKLRTNCAVIAACNPPRQRGKSGTSVGVGGPLLSRFDLVFLLWDTPQPELDEKIVDHIMSCSGGLGGRRVINGCRAAGLTVDEMARYLWWIRGQYAHVDGPKLSDSAADLLGRYFDILRTRGAAPALDDNIPVTTRMLESLVRLTQAFAKLHLQSLCSEEDAAMAIFLMERSAHGLKCSLGDNVYSSSRCLDDVFLSDDEKHLQQQQHLLQILIHVIYHYAAAHRCDGEDAEVVKASSPANDAELVSLDGDILTSRRKGLMTVAGASEESSGFQSQVARSVHLLHSEVCTPFQTPCTVSQYPQSREQHTGRNSSSSKAEVLFSATQRSTVSDHGGGSQGWINNDLERRLSFGDPETGMASVALGQGVECSSSFTNESSASTLVTEAEKHKRERDSPVNRTLEGVPRSRRNGSEIMDALRFRF